MNRSTYSSDSQVHFAILLGSIAKNPVPARPLGRLTVPGYEIAAAAVDARSGCELSIGRYVVVGDETLIRRSDGSTPTVASSSG